MQHGRHPYELDQAGHQAPAFGLGCGRRSSGRGRLHRLGSRRLARPGERRCWTWLDPPRGYVLNAGCSSSTGSMVTVCQHQAQAPRITPGRPPPGAVQRVECRHCSVAPLMRRTAAASSISVSSLSSSGVMQPPQMLPNFSRASSAPMMRVAQGADALAAAPAARLDDLDLAFAHGTVSSWRSVDDPAEAGPPSLTSRRYAWPARPTFGSTFTLGTGLQAQGGEIGFAAQLFRLLHQLGSLGHRGLDLVAASLEVGGLHVGRASTQGMILFLLIGTLR